MDLARDRPIGNEGMVETAECTSVSLEGKSDGVLRLVAHSCFYININLSQVEPRLLLNNKQDVPDHGGIRLTYNRQAEVRLKQCRMLGRGATLTYTNFYLERLDRAYCDPLQLP